MSVMRFFFCALLCALALWSNYSIRAERLALFRPAQRYTQYSFYKRDGVWTRNWMQCEMKGSVAFMLDAAEANPQHYLSFKKSSPAQRRVTELSVKHESDCAMQKCWWAFNAPSEAGRSYVVEESHYYEPEDGFWTNRYKLGVGVNESSAERRAQPCRWFLRTRASVMTERRSIYITETKAGQPVLRVYDYKRASERPSLLLKGGQSSFNAAGDIETFTFKNKGFIYVIEVGASESKPLAEVTVKKGRAVIQRENCRAYTYLKKSQA